MSIYIPNMDMPTNAKDEVITIYPDGTVLKYSLDSDFHNAKSRAIEVQPHGRCIDADAFEAHVQNEWENNEISNGEWIRFREWLMDEPTIIPAEPGEEADHE